MSAGCMGTPGRRIENPIATDSSVRAARAEEILAPLAQESRSNRRLGLGLSVAGAIVNGGLGATILVVDSRDGFERAGVINGVGFLAAGVLSTALAIRSWTPSDEEELHTRFHGRVAGDPDSAVNEAESELASLSTRRHRTRTVARIAALVVAASGITAIVLGKQYDSDGPVYLGAVGLLLGGFAAIGLSGPLPAEVARSRWKLELGASASATGDRVPTLGVATRF